MSRFGTPGDPFKKLEDQRFKEEMDRFRKAPAADSAALPTDPKCDACVTCSCPGSCRVDEDNLCVHCGGVPSEIAARFGTPHRVAECKSSIDNDRTTDPTPALLSTARLSAIREDADLCREAVADGVLRPESSSQAVYDAARRLLGGDALAMAGHLAALQAPAAASSVRKLYRDLRWEADGDKPHVEEMVAIQMYERGDAHGYARGVAAGRSEGIDRPLAALRAAGFKVTERPTMDGDDYARGFAAGAVAVSGEGDDPAVEGAILILMKRHDDELHEAHANGRAEGSAEIARLTAELAEARATLDARMGHLDAALTTIGTSSAAARREGAREEREACAALLAVVDRITFDAPDDKPNGPGEQAIDDISKALNLDAWPLYLHPRIAELNGYMATLTKAWADEARDLKAAASVLRARAEGRPPCPGEGWEWDAFALQWFQPGAKGKAIATSRARGEGQGS